eukprot:9050307-Pyramimonas_sp.AAC.2
MYRASPNAGRVFSKCKSVPQKQVERSTFRHRKTGPFEYSVNRSNRIDSAFPHGFLFSNAQRSKILHSIGV